MNNTITSRRFSLLNGLVSLPLLVNHKNSYSKVLKTNLFLFFLLLKTAFSILKKTEHYFLNLSQVKSWDLRRSTECFSFELKAQMDGVKTQHLTVMAASPLVTSEGGELEQLLNVTHPHPHLPPSTSGLFRPGSLRRERCRVGPKESYLPLGLLKPTTQCHRRSS